MIECIWPDRFGTPPRHHVLGTALVPPFAPGYEIAVFSMGCFWGAERGFWTQHGIQVTAVGYTGGHSLDPDYHEVCSGDSGHAEAVLVVADPRHVTFGDLLRIFWEGHDPTQGMRQGNDIGTQYRSGIHAITAEQFQQAERSRADYQLALGRAGFPAVTTEIVRAGDFYYAEPYHQQYLAKNPSGYCGLGGTGIRYREVGSFSRA